MVDLEWHKSQNTAKATLNWLIVKYGDALFEQT